MSSQFYENPLKKNDFPLAFSQSLLPSLNHAGLLAEISWLTEHPENSKDSWSHKKHRETSVYNFATLNEKQRNKHTSF